MAFLPPPPPAGQDAEGQRLAELADHPRQEICEAALRDWGLVVVCDDLESCARLSDSFAPEHLELLTRTPMDLVGQIHNAGAVFLDGLLRGHRTGIMADYIHHPIRKIMSER